MLQKIHSVSIVKKVFSLTLIALAAAFGLLVSCSAALHLATSAAVPGDITGTYRLYLYGCRFPDDIENMALMVNTAAPFRVNLFVPDTSYRVLENVAGPAALDEARKFISCSVHDTGRSVLRRIVDKNGNTIAFELKPLYSPMEMGTDEVLQTDYFLRNDVLTVGIKLDPTVERTWMYTAPKEGDSP
jgi:hypothetical protein